jgi:hypothetical protein
LLLKNEIDMSRILIILFVFEVWIHPGINKKDIDFLDNETIIAEK